MSGSKPCDGCGMPIEFHQSPNGKPMPVQRVRNVYIMGAEGKLEVALRSEARPGTMFVSHFETCPRASSFSRSGSKPRAIEP